MDYQTFEEQFDRFEKELDFGFVPRERILAQFMFFSGIAAVTFAMENARESAAGSMPETMDNLKIVREDTKRVRAILQDAGRWAPLADAYGPVLAPEAAVEGEDHGVR